MPFAVDVTARLSMLEEEAAGSINRGHPLYIERCKSVMIEINHTEWGDTPWTPRCLSWIGTKLQSTFEIGDSETVASQRQKLLDTIESHLAGRRASLTVLKVIRQE